ncbi:hypothetical protein KAX01_03610, partial [Candidatus Bathyarchaeota archaeon]|nr:hypothetical protein [Candidatus Bathyarchaeota archaeon]
MPSPRIQRIHKAGIRVLKAISASIRIQILNLLQEKGSLSYSELMISLKLDSTRDAGRFAYHLKFLLKADLIEPDVENRKYRLTDLGRYIIKFTDEIEDQTYKRRKMLVRTSHFSIEEFDRNRITQSLVIEANVPTDLAQKIARETEKRLQQFKTKYLTAPLIREIVNTILLEKHYEDYRHDLTRLGLPVHEVSRLIETSGQNIGAIQKAAGDAVMEEYTLLNILPREISDAYLGGSLHLNSLATWILKPNEIIHNLSFFLRSHKPKTLETALNLATNIIRNAANDIIGYQSLENFNTYLAPFTKDLSPNRVRELLRLFIRNLSQTNREEPTTLTLELSTEDGYAEEANHLALLLLEVLREENESYPLRNPKIVAKIRRQSLGADEVETLLYKAHELASRSVLVYFANLCSEEQKNTTYTASGLRMKDDWLQDQELDVQRTGNLDVVTVNLPRLSFESKGDEDKFLELLDNQLKMASQALEIKYQAIKRRMEQNRLLYFSQRANNDQYFRLENASRTIASIGLPEAVEELMVDQGHVPEDYGKAFVLTEKILKHIHAYVKKQSKKPRIRLSSAIVPNKTAAYRLAELDVEKYGWGVVRTRGSKDHPHYSDINRVSLSEKEQLLLEERIHQLTLGGHLTLIQLPDQPTSAEALLAKTRQLVASDIGFFAYNTSAICCRNCGNTFSGLHLKCPNCSSINIFSVEFC